MIATIYNVWILKFLELYSSELLYFNLLVFLNNYFFNYMYILIEIIYFEWCMWYSVNLWNKRTCTKCCVIYWFKMNAKAAVNDVIKTIIDATLIPMVKKIKVNVMRTFRLIQMNFFLIQHYIYNGLKKYVKY